MSNHLDSGERPVAGAARSMGGRFGRPPLFAGLMLAITLAVGTAATWFAVPTGASHRVRATGAVREFHLVAEPVRWEIQPGQVIDGWGYNGQIPGPTLRAAEGDLIRIHLVNRLPVATTIHWHGIDVPLAMDGVPGLSQEPVEPGEHFTYEFLATNPGTRMYHSHQDTDAQMQLGMFGALIIDPQQPEPVRYDREFTYILSEKALDFTPAVALGQAQLRHRDAGNGRGGTVQTDLFLLNGRSASAIEPMTIKAGERIRLRMINLGNQVHTMHLHGHSFKIIATDGNPVPPAGQWLKDTVLIGPGERYDVAIEGNNPGIWMFHCHINNHAANGMSTALIYEGARPVVEGDFHGSHGPGAALPTPGPTPTPTPARPAGITVPPAAANPPAAPPTGATAAGGSAVVMLDDRFATPRLNIKVGTTISWVNQGTNLHTATSNDGLFDSGNVANGERFSYTFNAVGTYRYLCRLHLLQGMRGTVTVEE